MDDRPGNLKDLATRINHEHENAERELGQAIRHGRAFLEAARRTGDLLNEAKTIAGHGNWMQWVRENVSFSHATANLYQLLADGWDLLENSDSDPNFGLHEAVRRIRLLRKGESPEGDGDQEGPGSEVPVVDVKPRKPGRSGRLPRAGVTWNISPRLTEAFHRDANRFEVAIDRAIESAERLRPTAPIILARNAQIRVKLDALDTKLGT